MESFSESSEFDPGFHTSNSVINEQSFWDDVPNDVETLIGPNTQYMNESREHSLSRGSTNLNNDQMEKIRPYAENCGFGVLSPDFDHGTSSNSVEGGKSSHPSNSVVSEPDVGFRKRKNVEGVPDQNDNIFPSFNFQENANSGLNISLSSGSHHSVSAMDITQILPRNSRMRTDQPSSLPKISFDRSTEIGSSSSSKLSADERPPTASTTETMNLVHVQQNLANGSTTTPENVGPAFGTGTGFGANQSGTGFGANQSLDMSLNLQNAPRRMVLPEPVLRPFQSSSSVSTGQSIDFAPQQSGQHASLQDVGREARLGLRRLRPYLRSTGLLEGRIDGDPAVPVETSRERMERIMRIRRMISSMLGHHPSEDDSFAFDDAITTWGARLFDRHRGMRLDVDNMSYEELLELQERIGDVSTGLSEEVMLKCLKQRKFFTIVAPPEIEPCCICLEIYADGEDVGELECGHDFHAGCIKEWLQRKNSCPICKTAALANADAT